MSLFDLLFAKTISEYEKFSTEVDFNRLLHGFQSYLEASCTKDAFGSKFKIFN